MKRHVDINRDYWDGIAQDWAAGGEHAWVSEPSWGNWSAPEAELRLLPDDMSPREALDAIYELKALIIGKS